MSKTKCRLLSSSSKSEENDSSLTEDEFDQDKAIWFEVVSKKNPESSSSNKPAAPIVANAYASASALSMKYLFCGDGLFVTQFMENQPDGIIQLSPGATKKRNRSKNSSLKFYVLQGKVDITCAVTADGPLKVIKLETFCYMHILNESYYSMKNPGDVTTYILFNRFVCKPKEQGSLPSN